MIVADAFIRVTSIRKRCIHEQRRHHLRIVIHLGGCHAKRYCKKPLPLAQQPTSNNIKQQKQYVQATMAELSSLENEYWSLCFKDFLLALKTFYTLD